VRLRGAVSAGLAGATLAAGLADARSEIGGPPTNDLPRCFRELRPCSDPVVIGKAKHEIARVELVGYQSRFGLCIDVDILRIGGSGICGVEPLPTDGSAMEIHCCSVRRDPRLTFTMARGYLRPDVARIRVTYRRNGKQKRRRGGVAQVEGDLLEAVKEEEPFGVAEALLRGCVTNRRLRFTAFDGHGRVLERERTKGRNEACDNRRPDVIQVGVPRHRKGFAHWRSPG
jgi:hypothetical protein